MNNYEPLLPCLLDGLKLLLLLLVMKDELEIKSWSI